jgi:hypothetical protein
MKKMFSLVLLMFLLSSYQAFSQEKSVGTFESVKITNVSGTVEAFYPNGDHRLLKAGGAIPQITPAESGIIFRVLTGSLTFSVTIIDEKGRVKYEELAFLPGDLTRVTLSGPDREGQSQWQVFSNIDVTSRGILLENFEEGGSEFPEPPPETPPQEPPPDTPPPPPVSPFAP